MAMSKGNKNVKAAAVQKNNKVVKTEAGNQSKKVMSMSKGNKNVKAPAVQKNNKVVKTKAGNQTIKVPAKVGKTVPAKIKKQAPGKQIKDVKAETKKEEIKEDDVSVESMDDEDDESDFAEISGDELAHCSDDIESDSDIEDQEFADDDESDDNNDLLNLMNKSFKSNDVEDEDFELDSEASESSDASEELDTVKEPKIKQPYYPVQTKEEAKIDESTPEGKFLKQVDERKTVMHKRVILVNKLNRKENTDDLINTVSDCVGSYFKKSSNKRYINTGTGFLYFPSEIKAQEAIIKIHDAKLNKGKTVASPYKNSRVYSNFKHVNLLQLIGASNVAKDITTELKASIGNESEVTRLPNGYYSITLKNSQVAMALFNEKTKKVSGAEVLLNFNYDLKNTYEKNVLPTPAVVGKKRALNDSDSETTSKKFKNTPESSKKIMAGKGKSPKN